jgi:glycosyltransferase involved in cell wall biosynthesis
MGINKLKISIVITAYNMGKFLEDTLDSVIKQTYNNIEVIIVEDCSTDNTKEIIKKYQTQDDRIKVIYHKENMGAGWGRRHGIEASTGDYFITVDGDDWLDPTFIESLVKRAEETDADIVSGGITIERGEGYWEKTSYGRIICEGIDKVSKFWGEKVVFMNNKIIKKYLGEKVPYCTRRFIEDTPTIIPMLWYANKVAYTDDTGYHYRMQDNSLTHQADEFKYALFRTLCGMDLVDFFKENDEKVLEKIPLKRMVEQQIAIIKTTKPTIEQINKYTNEWVEFTSRLLI